MNSIVRSFAALALVLAVSFASPAALAVDSGDIIVVSSKGEVHFTVSGVARTVRAGGVLELPASLRTGRDGAVELRQGATTVSVGPETLLEFPALEKRGAPIDRILQPRGNAFYNIGKREGRKLRVETPYLVGVIKGTQFNVAALDESTTISLFEGLLEVRATDDSHVVDLRAGEIASRRRGDKSISVMKMDSGKAPTTAPRPSSGNGSSNGAPGLAAPRGTPASDGHDSALVDRDGGASPPVPRVVATLDGTGAAVGVTAGVTASAGAGSGVDAGVTASATGANGVEVGANAAANVANAASVNVNAGLNAGPTGVDVAADTRVDAGPAAVDTGTAVSVGVTGVDLTTSTSVDAGPVAVDTAATASVDTAGVDVATATAVDAGPIAVDVAGSAAVDLASAAVDTTASTSVDAGPLTTDVGTTTAVDLGAGTVGTGVTVAASAPQVQVDVGTSVAADAGAGTVNIGLDVAGADLGLGLDLGLDNANSTPDTGSTTPDTSADSGTPDTVVDVGGLLDRLLRRPGRR